MARGYRSIGCEPCTRPVGADEDARAGRWSGTEKTECGLHFVQEGLEFREVEEGEPSDRRGLGRYHPARP